MRGRRRRLPVLALLVLASLAACSTGWQGRADDPRPSTAPLPPGQPAPKESGSMDQAQSQQATPGVTVEPEDPALSLGAGWKTDFRRHTVPLSELRSGGVPRDGIPPIDNPQFEAVEAAAAWLKDADPVMVYQQQNETRVYPLAILIWHEIVNDEVDGVPVVVTYCPLCNTGIVFDRRIAGRTLSFGVSGLLRHSDLVMWDRESESLWQQATGQAIVGELAGLQLSFLSSSIISWQQAREEFPAALVLSRATGTDRDYGLNPYDSYDSSESPFLYQGPRDERLPLLERVVGLRIGDEAVAYPFSLLAEERVIEDSVGGEPVVVFHQPGTASALDGPIIASSRDVGAAAAYSPLLDGRRLSFELRDGTFVDRETGSSWSVSGRALAGPLAGKQLAGIVHANHFWFAFSSLICAEAPSCRIYGQ